MVIVQSVLFKKSENTLNAAKEWITNHGYKWNDTAPNFKTKNFYSVRQLDPTNLEKYNYKFKNYIVDKKRRIYLILAYK